MSTTTAVLDPQHSALLIMDYQAGILDRLPDADVVLDRAVEAIEVMRRLGGHIGYVRVAFEGADFEAMPATSRMAALAADRRSELHANSPATAIHQRVAPRLGDIVVRKTRVGAFSTTDLDAQLRTRGADTLILAGLSTSGVLLSTVRDASDRDYALIVLSDASADPDTEVHAFLTQRILPRQAQVIAVAALAGLFAISASR